MAAEGKCIILSAPSGAGKTTIVRHLIQEFASLTFSVSATTRPPRGHEVNGHDYFFISIDEFKKEISRGGFVEWEEVYPGQFYGTLNREIEHIWAKGKNVIFDVDVVGGLRLKEYFGDKALSVFVSPPNEQALRQRLERRGTDSPEKIEMRLKKAAKEMKYADSFDTVLINSDLSSALTHAETLVRDFLQK